MQQASRGQRQLVSPIPSPTMSTTDSTFTVSKYGPQSHSGIMNGSSHGSGSRNMPSAAPNSGPRSAGPSNIPTSSRSASQPSAEQILASESIARAHWETFGRFLNAEQDASNPRQNRARDKLTRLSRTQFQELSTDVYDEVQRRAIQPEAEAISLAPNLAFHPKRNQAREKLSSLPTARFKDLVSDVFCEIERRFPNVAQFQNHTQPPLSNKGGALRNEEGRPTDVQERDSPRGNQSNNVYRQTAVIPNKSRMMEDDGDSDYENELKSPKVETDHASINSSDYGRPNTRSGNGSLLDQKTARGYESQIQVLQAKINDLEVNLKENPLASRQMKREMEDLLERNDKMEEELAELRSAQSTQKSEGLDKQVLQLKSENERLKLDLNEQQRIADEVRREAEGFLNEMRTMTERESVVYERSEKLQSQVVSLEAEIKHWREKVQQGKSELRQIKGTSHFFSPLVDFSDPKSESFVVPAGVINAKTVLKFQASIDTLLRTARTQRPQLLDDMSTIVQTIQNIERDLTSSHAAIAHDSRVEKLKQRMLSTTTNLTTACRNHINGGVFSPVSLVDAAASHLTSTVIEIVKSCKLKQSVGDENDDEASTSTTNGRAESSTRDYSEQTKRLSYNAGQGTKQLPDTVAAPLRQSPKKPASKNIVSDELRDYLEVQTEGIVSAIQKLLSAIRADAKPQVLQTYMDDIVTIVDRVTSSMRDAFLTSLPLRTSASSVINLLDNCTARIKDMEKVAPSGNEQQASKEFKQRLAGIAFDTAKQTKELSIILQRTEDDFDVDLT